MTNTRKRLCKDYFIIMAKDGTWSIDTHYFDYQSALDAVKQETLMDKFMIMHVEEYRYFDELGLVKIEKLIQRVDYENEENRATVSPEM